jgi:hypothetical protein
MCGATNIEELSFEDERGIRQGESASSLQWTLLYDIVLEWIESKNRKFHEDENLREYSNKTAPLHTQTPSHMLCWSISGIYAVATGKVAVCILCILWTDASSRQDKSNHRG